MTICDGSYIKQPEVVDHRDHALLPRLKDCGGDVECMVCCVLLHGPDGTVECTQDMHAGHKKDGCATEATRGSCPEERCARAPPAAARRPLLCDRCNRQHGGPEAQSPLLTAAVCSQDEHPR